jgi:hypothetical protein
MSDTTDNHIIAAHLAAAVFMKTSRGGLPQKEAVTIYFEVLKALEDAQAARHSGGTDSDITAAVVASRPVEEPKDGYSEFEDDDRAL